MSAITQIEIVITDEAKQFLVELNRVANRLEALRSQTEPAQVTVHCGECDKDVKLFDYIATAGMCVYCLMPGKGGSIAWLHYSQSLG